MIDRKAKDILFRAYWKNGWIPDDERTIDPQDFAYAKSKGYMFESLVLTHDKAVAQLIDVRQRVSRDAVAKAFLASLTSRRLDLRSALGSYAFALNFPDHEISDVQSYVTPSGAKVCRICGVANIAGTRTEDLNVLNFERHKWGGVRRDDPVYAWLDLTLFGRENEQSVGESEKQIFEKVLETARGQPHSATASSLERALVGVFHSSKSERRTLIEILAICGVLQPKDRPGYFAEFTPVLQREHTGQHLNDWCYPALTPEFYPA